MEKVYETVYESGWRRSGRFRWIPDYPDWRLYFEGYVYDGSTPEKFAQNMKDRQERWIQFFHSEGYKAWLNAIHDKNPEWLGGGNDAID